LEKRSTAPAVDQLVREVLGIVHPNNTFDVVHAHQKQGVEDTANGAQRDEPMDSVK
jgi:hypothetical protein